MSARSVREAWTCVLALGCGLTVSLICVARAYSWWDFARCPSSSEPKKWDSDPTMRYDPDDFDPESAEYDDLYYAIWAWNDIPSSDRDFVIDEDTTDGHTDGNNENEVYFATVNAPDNVTTAETVTREYCDGNNNGHIIEKDIIFYKKFHNGAPITWYTGAPEWNGTKYGELNYLRIAAVHELGHGMGFIHGTWTQPGGMDRMHKFFPNGGFLHEQAQPWLRVIPLPEEVEGMREFYPTATPEYVRDFFADPYQDNYVTCEGGQNECRRTYNVCFAGNYVTKYPWPVVDRGHDHLVQREDRILVNTCWGNFGNQPAAGTVYMAIKMSQDRAIGVDDYDPGWHGSVGAIPAEYRGCYVWQMYEVPYNIPESRWYYVGWWVDDQGQHVERYESNNRALSYKRLYVQAPE